MNIKEWLFIGLFLAGLFGFQYMEINRLKSINENLSQTVSKQNEKINNMDISIKGIIQDDTNRSESASKRDSSNAKIQKDTRAEDVFAKKPGLLENMINKSFDKFANDIVEKSK